MRCNYRWLPCAISLVLGVVAGAGCGPKKEADGLTVQQRQTGDRLTVVAKKVDGDWSRLDDADRKFLLDMSNGSEPSAKMLLLGAAGKLGNRDGGKPSVGGPAPGPGGPASGPGGPPIGPGGPQIGPPSATGAPPINRLSGPGGGRR